MDNTATDAYLNASEHYQAYRVADRDGLPMSLDAIWQAHGRPWLSPARFRRRWEQPDERFQADADGHLWAEPAVTLLYLEKLDHRLAIALNAQIFKMFRADPARQMIRGHDVPLVGMLAAHAARSQGESQAATRERIIAEVADRTEGNDEMERETIVARSRRAFGGTRDSA